MHASSRPSRSQFWLSTVPVFLILLYTVAQGTSEKLQAKMVSLGEEIWPGYAALRQDPPPPSCDPASFDAPTEASAGRDELDALFDGEGEASADDELDALFDGEGEASADDELDALFDGEEDAADSVALEQALMAAKAECEGKHARYHDLVGRLTPGLKVWRRVEGWVASVTTTGRSFSKIGLVVLIMICAATATWLRAHIALRPVRTRLDNTVSEGVQLIVNMVLIGSCWTHYRVVANSGIDVEYAALPLYWIVGLGMMCLINLFHIRRPPDDLEPGGELGQALLTQPLYTSMALISASWFLLFEGYPSGMAVYLDKLVDHASLYVQVGLYVWAGMLLKQSAIDDLSFDLLRPWKLPPELLAAVVVTLAAVPTAYSGASGIFVIAAGAIVYRELRKAGARNQLALAATAMSGSLGVVLAPCLLVVIVAALNKQVTTTELFGAGRMVFLLTAVLFTIAVLLTRQNPLKVAPVSEAVPGTIAALGRLVPHVAIFAGVILLFYFGLDTGLNEHTAPVILPFALLLVLVYERKRPADEEGATGFQGRVVAATTETSGHIGALLLLMTLSVCLGGVVERAEVMNLVPADLGSPVVTMAFLTVLLVGVGMVMDPYGAVILVSATVAHVAYDNGIAPLHFWMVVLVAFELGYLTPPVALNHLLTRQVVGDQADAWVVPEGAGFWARHERILLPVSVMGTALLIVAFGPFLVGGG